ncbi:MAG: peptidyl-prolyl cis-trans isomerase [Desulfurivibrionaceae bacterium]
MMYKLKLACSLMLLLLFSLPQAGETREEEKETTTAGAAGDEVTIDLEAPLFAEAFSDTPVAMVNEEPITFGDLTRYIASMHSDMGSQETKARKDYSALLERLITIELICQEARNMELHKSDRFRDQIEDFKTKTLLKSLMAHHLQGIEPDEEKVEKLDRRMSRELLLWTLRFRDEEDAADFRGKIEEGGDFEELAEQYLADNKAEGDKDEEYVKLKDLRPQIAQEAFGMEDGAVSRPYQNQGEYLIFKIEDSRYVDDPGVRKEARQKALQDLKKKKAREYSEELKEKYANINEKLYSEVDFEKQTTGYLWFEETKPADFDQLLKDNRVLATVHGPGDEPVTITVADLARKIKESSYHGVGNPEEKHLNQKKKTAFENMLFKTIGRREAVNLGLDQKPEFLFKLEERKNSLLFNTFISKVIAPDINLQDEELRQYYENHIDEYSTPTMLKLRSLAFEKEKDAKEALAKLNRDAAFQWVSANSPGQADKDSEGLLDFSRNLVSLTSLPEDLHHQAEDAEEGDFILYLPEDNDYSYVLAVTEIHPSKPRPYKQVRDDIRKIIYGQKLREEIENYVDQLKEAYETRIFAKGLDQT